MPIFPPLYIVHPHKHMSEKQNDENNHTQDDYQLACRHKNVKIILHIANMGRQSLTMNR